MPTPSQASIPVGSLDTAEAYLTRGDQYSERKDYAHAIADYSQAIMLRPSYAYAYNNRGVAYMASGHPDEALRDFDRAIQLQPDFPQAYSNRGNAYYRAGRTVQAISDFYSAEKFSLGLIAVLFAILLLGVVIGYRAVRRR